jgi:hypothetical protein
MLIDDLCRFVRIETPGVLDEIIVQAIAGAASEFCDRARVWDEICTPIALVDGVGQYSATPPTDARTLSIVNVWVADQELLPITLDALAMVMPNWQSAQGSAPRYYNAVRDWGAITVFPRPAAPTGALTFRAQYAPKPTSTTLPDFLADRFHDALIAGAKARLFSQINVTWSNPAMAGYHQQIFNDAVERARIEQLHSRVPSTLRVQPVRFG